MQLSGTRSRFTILAVSILLLAAPAGAEEWQWNFTPYVWGAGVGVDVQLDDRELLDETVPLSDLIDGLDFAGWLHFEGQRGKTGFFLDLSYLDFDDDPHTVDLTRLPISVTARGDFELTMAEAGFLYNPSGDRSGVSLLVGTRIFSVDQQLALSFTPELLPDQSVSVSSTLYDGLLGVRYVAPFAGSWNLVLRGDVSGGGTELTWNAAALLGYTFGEADRYTVAFGYRYMEIELQERTDRGAKLETEIAMSGPAIGFNFAF